MQARSADLEQLRGKLDERGAGNFAELILARTRGCVRLESVAGDPYATLGQHRLGGEPDLPEGYAWPAVQVPAASSPAPAGFLGQLNLADLPPTGLLPVAGLLSFFYSGPTGTGEHGQPFVLWFAPEMQLSRRSRPPAAEFLYQPFAELKPTAIRSTPSVAVQWSAVIDPAGPESDEVHDLLTDIMFDMEPELIAQVFGFAGDADLDLHLQAALEAAGHGALIEETSIKSEAGLQELLTELEDGDPEPYARLQALVPELRWWFENRPALLAEARSWHCLLSVEPNDEMDLDLGPLFFLAHESHIRAGDFSRVIVRSIDD